MTIVLLFIAARTESTGIMTAIQPLFPLLEVSRISAAPEKAVTQNNQAH